MTVSPSVLAVGIPACTPESFAGQGACSLNSPPPLAVRIPACTPESFAGQGACSLNSPPPLAVRIPACTPESFAGQGACSLNSPPPLAVRIPACTPESFAGQGACSLNSPPHPARGEGRFVSRLRDFHTRVSLPRTLRNSRRTIFVDSAVSSCAPRPGVRCPHPVSRSWHTGHRAWSLHSAADWPAPAAFHR